MKRFTLIMLFYVLTLLMIVQPSFAGDPQIRHDRPVPMGVSISTTPTLPFISAGTAGMRVRSLFAPDVKFILSNNHIIGSVGPNLCPNTSKIGTWVLQPGTLDIGTDPGNNPLYLAGVKFHHIPIDFTPGADNLVDAAVAYTVPELADTKILDIGAPTPAVGIALPGMNVIKSGRTTGVTTGTVLSINTTVLVSYNTCGTAKFVKQVIVTPGTFSSSGDSGSVVLDSATLTPVGLLFAGGPFSTTMHQILHVYLSLGVFVDF